MFSFFSTFCGEDFGGWQDLQCFPNKGEKGTEAKIKQNRKSAKERGKEEREGGRRGYPHEKKMNVDTDLIPFTKFNSKWTKDLNVKCKTIKLLEDNIGENLNDFRHGDDFLDITPKAWSMKDRIDETGFIKIKNLCSVKKNIKRMRRQDRK